MLGGRRRWLSDPRDDTPENRLEVKAKEAPLALVVALEDRDAPQALRLIDFGEQAVVTRIQSMRSRWEHTFTKDSLEPAWSQVSMKNSRLDKIGQKPVKLEAGSSERVSESALSKMRPGGFDGCIRET